MVHLTVFYHLCPLGAHLDLFGHFQTKVDLWLGSYRRKSMVWMEKNDFVKEIHLKTAFSKRQKRHHLTLGGQTIDTSSTLGLFLGSLGYNSSNQLLGRSLASKLSQQQAETKFHQCDMQIREKWKFFNLRPKTQKGSGGSLKVKQRLYKGEETPFWRKVAAGPF